MREVFRSSARKFSNEWMIRPEEAAKRLRATHQMQASVSRLKVLMGGNLPAALMR